MKSIFFNFLDKPKILDTNLEKHINAAKEERLSITCTAIGIPKPEIYWLNNDEIIHNKTIDINTSNTTLLQKNYTCVSQNGFGIDFQNISINIFGKLI